MRKIIFSVIAVIIILLSVESNAACPPGYSGPYTIRDTICPGCYIEADWCCTTEGGPGGTYSLIHFSNVRLIGDCISSYCIPLLQNGTPGIPWEKLIAAVIESHKGCFRIPLPIYPCDPPDPRSQLYKVSNGGCYSVIDYYDSELNHVLEYIPCDANQITYCFSHYTICYEFSQLLGWHIKVTGQNPQPGFQCEGDCFPFCGTP
jgi:hypothetical protein